MIFFHKYIDQFLNDPAPEIVELGNILAETKASFDVFQGGDPTAALDALVERYNWLGQKENKSTYNISQNLARNLPGSMMQDYLLHLMIMVIQPFLYWKHLLKCGYHSEITPYGTLEK